MNRPERLALLATLALLPVFASKAPVTAQAITATPVAVAATTANTEVRLGSLDVIILLDKSLSMASCIADAKNYLAGKVLGPLLVPGDRLIVETVYGKVDRLVSTSIGSQEDVAKAIRAIRGVKADGRFTDLGAALDRAKQDLDELGQPERPKYVLLVTDERQEAPKGSVYQSTDFKLKHPSLEYVKRVDLGKFRAITVGLQVAAKVDKTAPSVMQLLEEPPVRASSEDSASGTVTKTAAPASAAGSAAGRGQEIVGKAAGAGKSGLPPWLLYVASGVFIAALAGLAIALLLSRGKKRENESEKASASE